VPERIWNGTVSFGLVTIPVTMSLAVRDRGIHFSLLHDEDNARLVLVMRCPDHDPPEAVPADHQVRGYEVDEGVFVVVTDEELDSVAPERSRSIEIEDFVDVREIDPVYYDRPYYLVPGRGAEKPYDLLARTLEQSRRAGLARFVLRRREHLAAIAGMDGALCLLLLHFAEQVRDGSALVPDVDADAGDVEAMVEAIGEMASTFKPKRYRDRDRELLTDLIERKREETGTVEAPEPEIGEEAGGEAAALLDALQQSLEKARSGGGGD